MFYIEGCWYLKRKEKRKIGEEKNKGLSYKGEEDDYNLVENIKLLEGKIRQEELKKAHTCTPL